MQDLGEEHAAMGPKRSSPNPHETLDKTAVLTALALLGLGMIFLSAMAFMLFPEWIRPRTIAESNPPPLSIVTLRPPAPFEEEPVPGVSVSPVRRPAAPAAPQRVRPVAAANTTRNLLAAELDTPRPASPPPDLGLTVEPLPIVVAAARQVVTGVIVAVGNGSLTVQTANGLVVVKVRDDTMILANGQLRSARDAAVGQSVAVLGDAQDPTGTSSSPVTSGTPKDTPSGSGPGVGIEVKGIGVKVR